MRGKQCVCWRCKSCMLTSSSSEDADRVDRQSSSVLFRVREMHPWAFCPACHLVPLWSFAAHVVSHMGSWARKRRKGIFYKPQIVSSFQIKHCCLSKKNELKIRAISILVRKREEAPFTYNRQSFFLDRAMPTTAFLFLSSFYPPQSF